MRQFLSVFLILISLTSMSQESIDKSKMDWFDIDQCRKMIRPYNLEKINLIENVNRILTKHNIFMV